MHVRKRCEVLTLDVLRLFDFIIFLHSTPKNDALKSPILKIIFKFCYKVFNEFLRPFLNLVQAVLNCAVGQSRN